MSFQCATAPNTVFETREELHAHYKSDWHKYNLRRRAAGLAPITKEVFDKVRAMAAQQDANGKQSKKQDHLKASKRGSETASRPSTASVVEEPTEEQIEEKLRQELEKFEPNPLRCIFDGHISETVEDNLRYMHHQHGFIVHDLDCCVDLSGFISYLQEKVQVGKICLYCQKEFRSTMACIAHMTSKAHCKIAWEYEDEIEEYVDYYDFELPTQDDSLPTLEYDSTTGEIVIRDAEGNATKRLGSSKRFRDVYREIKAEKVRTPNAAIQNALRERTMQLYQTEGILALSTTTPPILRQRLSKLASADQLRWERRFQKYALKDGIQVNLLIKNRKAGTNRGIGHGVHG